MRLRHCISIFSTLALLFCSFAQADWNVQSLQWEQMFNSSPALFPNGFLAETWSAAQEEPTRDAHLYVKKVSDPRFGSGHFSVTLQTKRDGTKPKPAPLMIYLPGLFSSMDSSAAMRAGVWFSSRGYHVVVPSNPWSTEFIQNQPLTDPGNVEVEAEIALAAIQYAVDQIGRENVTSISITGESYGALLTAVAFAKDQASPSPLIDGSVTLLSPPEDLQTAIDRLDQGIFHIESTQQNQCFSIQKLVPDYFAAIHEPSQDKMPEALVDCAQALVFQSFHDNLVQSIVLLHKVNGAGVIPTGKQAFSDWKRNMRFSEVVRDFTPANQTLLNEGKGSLSYWLKLLPESAYPKLRILTAQDDFLNAGLPWPTNEGGITPKSLMMIDWGGHTGYFEAPLFQKLLDAAYSF